MMTITIAIISHAMAMGTTIEANIELIPGVRLERNQKNASSK